MPVAAAHAKDGQIFQHYQHLLPKSPRFHGQLSPTSIVTNSEGIFTSHDRVTLVNEYGHLTTVQASAHGDATEQFFSTHSPPLINLSPNLSPIAEPQRTSPFYDFRETTRRRGLNGKWVFICRWVSQMESINLPKLSMIKSRLKVLLRLYK